jgi:hypothetical protein
MAIIAADQSPQVRSKLAAEAQFRKEFAKNLRELLAVAEEARVKGVAERPVMRRQLELMRSVVIAENYFNSLSPGKPGPAQPNVTDSEIEVFFSQPANQQKFAQFLDDAKNEKPELAQTDIPADQIKQVRQELGKVLIGEQKGVAAGFDQKRKVQLQILLEQAQVLARRYAQEYLKELMTATDSEIEAYIAQHPEYDTRQLKLRAAAVLKRARAGEDFARLAVECSSDAGSKTKGGDLGWFGAGIMVPEFEKAAFALNTGQISGVIETKFGFHIIKLEGRRLRRRSGKLQREVRARHILISWDPPDKSPTQMVRDIIEREKQSEIITEIVKRSHVTISAEFRVDPPPTQAEPKTPPNL